MPTTQEQKPVHAELTEFEALLEAAVDAVIVIESNGKIVAFSRSAERLFGYSAGEIIGQPVSTLMPEPHRSAHPGYIAQYEATGEAHVIGVGREVSALRSDGTIFPVWLSVGESITDSGHRYVGMVRDLTRQHVAEMERRSLEMRLAHVSRLSLLGEMAAGIAHEINQPLTAIANYAHAARNVLERDCTDLEMLHTACAGIGEQVQRAGDVITNLRNFVRKREVERSRIKVADLIGGIMVLINADAVHEGVTVEMNLAEDLPEISGNAVQLQQVLLNLTRNAVDAMGSVAREKKTVQIGARVAAPGRVEIYVSDRGTGVPESLKKVIFNPFFSTKPEGLGVGLAISRTIVEAHGGELTCDERDGGGATFTMTLPILER